MASEDVPNTYPAPVHIGVIGGTGLDTLPGFHKAAVLTVTTPWGAPSSPITILEHPSPTTGHPIPIAFLARHGPFHELLPSEIPVRANIAAFRHIGVRCIIAFSAAGSLAEEVKPRDFVVPDQAIDRTKGIRPHTFFEDGFVLHVPFADPFDKKVGDVVRRCGHSLEGDGVRLHDTGCLIVMGSRSNVVIYGVQESIGIARFSSHIHYQGQSCTDKSFNHAEGPQFSTRAESNLYRTWGGTVINMSTLPEAKLAAEAEIAYQVILMSTDYDCWHDSGDVTVEMVMGHMRANAVNARRFIAAVLDELSKEEHDELVRATHLAGARKFGISTYPQGRSERALEKMRWLFEGYF